MIIKPTLNPEPEMLGDRYDADPGDYTARLFDVRYIPEDTCPLWLEWHLTNHPLKVYRWPVSRGYSPRAIGFLKRDLWAWKRKKWQDLGDTIEEKLGEIQTWIGDEANVRVISMGSDYWSPRYITEIWSLGMSGPRSWEDDEDYDPD